MTDDAAGIEKLYEYGERLSEAKDKSQHVEDYRSIIKAAGSDSIKAMQLAAQLIPRFFKFFPELSDLAVDSHIDLCEADELGVRVQAIRGLPLFCKDTPEHLSKIIDILAQLLTAEENVERDAVHKALLSLLRQDVKVVEGLGIKPFRQFYQGLTGQTSKESSDVHMGWLSITIRNRWSDFSSHGILELGDGSKIPTDFINRGILEIGDGRHWRMFEVEAWNGVFSVRSFHTIIGWAGMFFSLEEHWETSAPWKMLYVVKTKELESVKLLLRHCVHIESVDEPNTDENLRENLRERTLCFVRDKVFPLKAELLKPQEQMERHITDLIKKSLQDVTGAEFKMFIDFLKSLSLFGEKAPPERVQELVEIIEGQADLDAQFNGFSSCRLFRFTSSVRLLTEIDFNMQVSDGDHIDRLISCLFMALPFFVRGASPSKFLNYLNKHILPVFDEITNYGLLIQLVLSILFTSQLPEERKVDLLKNLAESSPYTTPQDSRQILPSVVQLLKKYMPRRKSGEETNFTYVECLLYTFHHLASKAPNATNSLCGFKIVTGQPSDRLGEDFSEFNKDFTESPLSFLRPGTESTSQLRYIHVRGIHVKSIMLGRPNGPLCDSKYDLLLLLTHVTPQPFDFNDPSLDVNGFLQLQYAAKFLPQCNQLKTLGCLIWIVKDWRLSSVEELARATIKKLTQGMAEHNKAMASAKSDEAKASIKAQKQNTTTGLRTCNNILAMTQPLHSKSPSFIGDKRINLSWKEIPKVLPPSATTAAGGKRPANPANGSNDNASKKGRGAGGSQNQLVNRAFEGASYGGRSGMRGRGRGWGGRGRGRGYR
ncbi:hypothetical protein RHSIM_Rhsim02G0138500 [Rhododendron simsii]|uniref:Apoptosis inhibitor 5 n=1 Tax=Rhododendron simsii TaxID=118357 RepID=A0A834HBT2_RHOSS|nr:hypothetical protein RHSIM_Rhsim02G0138500 [Rhododendron simsii]